MTYRANMLDFTLGVALGEAVLCLQGVELETELSRIAREVLNSPNVSFAQQQFDRVSGKVIVATVSEASCYIYVGDEEFPTESEELKLNILAKQTLRLLQVKARNDQRVHDSTQLQLQQQSQILDQIQESVITMDMAGFILSWNRGAEKLFGYSSREAVGQNILFLYEDEELDGLRLFDSFLQFGGREMEVRRRKKNGEVFWASLSLSPMCDAFNQTIGMIGYLSDITDRKQAEERINHLAYYDLLTDLPNRTLFKKMVDKALGHSHRKQSLASLMFIDINRFKPINDTLGHHVGDLLIKQIAERFRLTLREDDVIARLGSDEFAVALLNISQNFDPGLVAQKLLAALDKPFVIENHQLRIDASIGITVYPQDGLSADQLLRQADIAMYKVKRGGGVGGRYAFFDQEMNQMIAGRLQIESGLRRALEQNELALVYQPKVDIHSGRIVGAEALLRWNTPDNIPPALFIPIAEETGLILEIDAWVLDTACAQARAWQEQGVPPFRIAVNVTAKEFTSNLPQRVKDVISRYEISPEWLELEITESMLMQSAEAVTAIMDEIVALGVTLSLDDFGTGYSSLSYLKRFPISTLKIDRSFIHGIPADNNDCAIASAIIGVAKQLRHHVIAEGVENFEQFHFLKEAGCDQVQGYFFSRPIEAEQFSKMLGTDFRFDITPK
jgi:diguanylate cyclase (GGDEF)-like protein/PAS domain S-box-containing protein